MIPSAKNIMAYMQIWYGSVYWIKLNNAVSHIHNFDSLIPPFVIVRVWCLLDNAQVGFIPCSFSIA